MLYRARINFEDLEAPDNIDVTDPVTDLSTANNYASAVVAEYGGEFISADVLDENDAVIAHYVHIKSLTIDALHAGDVDLALNTLLMQLGEDALRQSVARVLPPPAPTVVQTDYLDSIGKMARKLDREQSLLAAFELRDATVTDYNRHQRMTFKSDDVPDLDHQHELAESRQKFTVLIYKQEQ